MLAVTLSESETLGLLTPDLSISLINGPNLCVVAGLVDAIGEFEAKLAKSNVICRPVQNTHAFHSRLLDPIVKAFEDEVRKVKLAEPKIPFVSNVTGTWVTKTEAVDPAYWARHTNHTARFSDALGTLWKVSDPVLLEAGPGKTIGVLAMQHPDRKNGGSPTVLSSLRHHYESRSDTEHLLHNVGGLWSCGVEINWDRLHQGERRRRISLPTYPFQRQEHWIDNAVPGESAEFAASNASRTGASGLDSWFYAPAWERTRRSAGVALESFAKAASWLVFSDRWGGGSSFRDKLERLGAVVQVVRFGKTYCRRDDGSIEIDPAKPDDYLTLFRDMSDGMKGSLNIVHLGCLTGGDDDTTDFKIRTRNQDFGFFSLLYIAQAVGTLGLSAPMRVALVTNRIHEVTGEESLDPEMATVLGPVRVVPHELPNVACFNVDLPGPGIAGELADDVVVKILSEFSGQKQTEVVAYRGRHRWERRYKPVTLRAPAPAAQDAGGSTAEGLRERGVYLITGGTGGIGLAFAKHLARTCRARIVLTKKAAFPEKSEWRRTLDSKLAAEGVLEIIKELHEIERLGAEVQVLVADASDHDQMRRAVNETLGKYQTTDLIFMLRAGGTRARFGAVREH
jgi:acyl transferase domain-containing protein